ncbi:DUF421 domain-containing protein [Cellulosilyticum sp. I15G10I2]|uniref:DUF421 domain-containing protein n=1 Tax=Cellulosilyticum sp. I15G10I2 TaxID=1892843 RepID=UPI00085CD26C|nr:DUF421 domain-containing protein [Cellulosilyticum sp. I15G10I2]
MFEGPISQLTFELIIGFFALFTLTKFVRRAEINAITPFDFLSAIVLGELLGNAIYDDEITIGYILYALCLWGILTYTVEWITQKFRRTRKLLEGDPAIIIRDGQIDYEVIKKQKLDINELLSILRQKDTFSIREIEFAILEQSGAISVLKKSQYDRPISQDLNLPYKPVFLSIAIILDGEVLMHNLKAIGFDEKWLLKQVRLSGVEKIEDVFYGEWKQDEGIHIVVRRK